MNPKPKAIQLFLLSYGIFHGGFTFSIIGPSLPDLQCLFSVDLGEIASLFLVLGMAVAVSSLISPFLLRLVNIYILMATMMVLCSLGVGAVAMTPYIYVAWAGLFATGYTSGIYFVCSMVLLSVFHKDDSYAWHLIATATSLGSFIGPLVAKPFIGVTEAPFTEDNVSFPGVNDTSFANVSMDVSSTCGSNINVLYIITGVIALSISFGVGLFCLLVKPKVHGMSVPNTKFCQIDTNGRPISMTKSAYTLLVFLSFPLAYGLAFAYGSYLTIIGLNGSLQMGIQRSALMTSLFWLMFLIGRAMSTLLSNCLQQETIIYICLTGQIISSGGLCVYGTTSEIPLWIGSLSFAFLAGPNYACLVTWSRDFITHTPTILSLFSLLDFAGTSFLPYISGVLISLYGQNAHMYFTFALCILEFCLFLAAHILGMKIFKDVKVADIDTTCISNSNGKIYESFNHTEEEKYTQ